MGRGFSKQAPIKTALQRLLCPLRLQQAGCETAISRITKNRLYKMSPKQTTSNSFVQTVKPVESMIQWKRVLCAQSERPYCQYTVTFTVQWLMPI